jgi:hypothetical protein
MLAFLEKVWYHIKAPVKGRSLLSNQKMGGAMKWLSVIFVVRA